MTKKKSSNNGWFRDDLSTSYHFKPPNNVGIKSPYKNDKFCNPVKTTEYTQRPKYIMSLKRASAKTPKRGRNLKVVSQTAQNPQKVAL